MHICFIEDTKLHGGTQIWVSEATRAFIRAGHTVTLLTPADGFNARDAVGTTARVVTYDYDDVVKQDARHQRIWTEALAPADVAVCTVHPPRLGFHCSRFAATCISEAGLDTVLQPKTGTIVPEYLREFYAPPEAIRYQVICITEFTRRYLIETYGIPADRISLVYQGTDLSTFVADENRAVIAGERYPLPADAFPVLGSVGSFEERKGQVLLLDAVARVIGDLPKLQLMFVGDGPDEALLRQKVIDENLEEHVTFYPFTRQPVEVFEVIDILVLSSTHKEGLPNVVLEAAAMGRPVISTRLAGTPEAVMDGYNGILVAPGDVDGLAAAIRTLGSDPDRCLEMGRAGRELMHQKFDKQRQFDAFLQMFTDLAERRPRVVR